MSEASASPATEEKKAAPKRKKIRRHVPRGVAHITAGFNNTIITITDQNGMALAWSSSGSSGFRGTRKSTPYAAQVAGQNVVEKVKPYGVEKIDVVVQGVGPGREQSIRGLHLGGLEVLSIKDITAIPHNGCRRRKARRV
jgi:small subunit ribosomal protein S11